MSIFGAHNGRRADAAAVAVLLATTVALAWPILTGGWWTYMDNPPHLAEIHSLAGEGAGGWSSVGFAGLSLDTLHSPLFMRLLALLAGTPLLGPVYCLLVCLGVAAPALAIYAVARRRIAPVPAAVLAYVVLIQRGTLVGSASATGGMWLFYLAAAAWVLLADQLARRERSLPAIAALLGFIGLTHMYLLQAAVLLFVVHAGIALATKQARSLGRDALAAGLAAAASAWYWLPMLLGAGVAFGAPQNLGLGDLARMLVLPVDAVELLAKVPVARAAGFVEAIPLCALLVAGVAGIVVWRRACRDQVAREDRRAGEDRLALYGALVAALVLVLLVVAAPLNLRLLGPNSWRFLYVVRLGAALAAIPLAGRLRAPRRVTLMPRRAAFALAAGSIASAVVWGGPLRAEVPSQNSYEIAEVRDLWHWLAAHARGQRVYIQDTFYAPPLARELSRSHVLALTLQEAGVEPLGPYYGVAPAATAASTTAEFGQLFDQLLPDLPPGTRINIPIGMWGTQLLVASAPILTARLVSGGWHLQAELGRFAVLSPPELGPLAPRGARDGLRRLVFDLDRPTVVAVDYHPFWKVVEGTAQLAEDPTGRIAIAGSGHIVLEYDPPRVWPASLAGWLGIAALWARRRKRSSKPQRA